MKDIETRRKNIRTYQRVLGIDVHRDHGDEDVDGGEMICGFGFALGNLT
jgi:hypothetical protein